MFKGYAVLAIIIIQMTICCASSSTGNSNEAIDLKIVSPYNCDYQLLIKGNKLTVQSKQYNNYIITDSVAVPSDTIVSGYDTLVADSIISIIDQRLNEIKKNKVIYDSIRGRDSYLYEVFLDGKLLIHKDGFEEDVFLLIKLLRPYIRNDEIKCCDFFESFDRGK
jgi:hypothetical protein